MPCPTKFDEIRARLAIRAARAGTQAEAARAAGIGRRTLQEWLRRGRAGEEPFAEFARAYRLAAEARRLTRLRAHWARYAARQAASWRRFKSAREEWWREQLGPAEFWRRRLRWLAELGRWASDDRALAEAREQGVEVE